MWSPNEGKFSTVGEKETLWLVAKYVYACTLFGHASLDTLKSKLNVLQDHCENVGRDYVYNIEPIETFEYEIIPSVAALQRDLSHGTFLSIRVK